MEVIRAQRATRSEFIVETTMISRGIVNLAFSARTEFSVATGLALRFGRRARAHDLSRLSVSL
jgi:hypothetical protein